MKNIDKLKEVMDQYDSEIIGERLYDTEILNEAQQEAIWTSVLTYASNLSLLDENELLYVVDYDGNEYIIPATYGYLLEDYEMGKGFFSDMLPRMHKLAFNKENKTGIIYYLNDINSENMMFLNKDAFNILRYMNPDEINTLIKYAEQNYSRTR